MIEVIHYKNEAFEKAHEASVATSYDEVRTLLPKLPKTMQIYFGDYDIMPEVGIGGYSYAPGIMTISLDPNFEDQAKQTAEIRPTVFHEAFHQAQDYSGEGPQHSPIETALYEGMATVFEREYADTFQLYGDYSQISEDDLRAWAKELTQLSVEDFQNEETSRNWRFYHPEYKERWIAYRVGAWITDQVLQKHNLTIIDLSTKTAAEVLELFASV